MSTSATTGCWRSRPCSRSSDRSSPISTCSSSPSRRTAISARRPPPRNLERALDLGVDVVGGIPHFERTMADGAASVKALCEIAARRGLMVDLHCDESDDPLSRHIETLAYEAQRLGLGGRVTGSHLTSMHSMDNYYVSKLLPLIAEAGNLRDRQSAHQHHAAGPARHLSAAARPDAHSGNARARHSSRARPGLRDGPLVRPRRRRHARRRPYGRACRADDQPRGHPLELRRGHRDPRRGSWG